MTLMVCSSPAFSPQPHPQLQHSGPPTNTTHVKMVYRSLKPQFSKGLPHTRGGLSMLLGESDFYGLPSPHAWGSALPRKRIDQCTATSLDQGFCPGRMSVKTDHAHS